MQQNQPAKDVVVYLIERHPLEIAVEDQLFNWLQGDDGFKRQLEDIIGPYNPDKLSMLVDESPAGPAWEQLLQDLQAERIRCLVTHLAPLSTAQRHQLIGVCAEMGTLLISPSDAGRNRQSNPSRS